MFTRAYVAAVVAAAAWSPMASSAQESPGHDPGALGADISRGWLDEWPHAHASRRGTFFVHTFANEPAFLGRDVLFDASFVTGDEGTEVELEAELEYALTRRIGVVVEAPFAFIDPRDGEAERGAGDVGLGPRFLLLDFDRFLLSANVGVSLPTGDSGRGLGAGEVTLAHSLSAWWDLGANVSVQGNAGVEHGLRSGTNTFVWGGAVAYSIVPSGAEEHGHVPEGLLSLIAEIRAEHPLDGDGSGTGHWVLGGSWSATSRLDVRAGVMLPAWSPKEFDAGVIVGLIGHF